MLSRMMIYMYIKNPCKILKYTPLSLNPGDNTAHTHVDYMLKSIPGARGYDPSTIKFLCVYLLLDFEALGVVLSFYTIGGNSLKLFRSNTLLALRSLLPGEGEGPGGVARSLLFSRALVCGTGVCIPTQKRK